MRVLVHHRTHPSHCHVAYALFLYLRVESWHYTHFPIPYWLQTDRSLALIHLQPLLPPDFPIVTWDYHVAGISPSLHATSSTLNADTVVSTAAYYLYFGSDFHTCLRLARLLLHLSQ